MSYTTLNQENYVGSVFGLSGMHNKMYVLANVCVYMKKSVPSTEYLFQDFIAIEYTYTYR